MAYIDRGSWSSDFTNQEIINAYNVEDFSLNTIDALNLEILNKQKHLKLLETCARVKETYQTTAICIDTMQSGEIYIYALGSESNDLGCRALIFKDENSGNGTSVRLHYRPNIKAVHHQKDPGSFDHANLELALNQAKNWVVCGKI